MTQNNGSNKLGNGKANICNNCNDPYREIQRLPGFVNKCPTCFEKMMNGELNETERAKETFLMERD